MDMQLFFFAIVLYWRFPKRLNHIQLLPTTNLGVCCHPSVYQCVWVCLCVCALLHTARSHDCTLALTPSLIRWELHPGNLSITQLAARSHTHSHSQTCKQAGSSHVCVCVHVGQKGQKKKKRNSYAAASSPLPSSMFDISPPGSHRRGASCCPSPSRAPGSPGFFHLHYLSLAVIKGHPFS